MLVFLKVNKTANNFERNKEKLQALISGAGGGGGGGGGGRGGYGVIDRFSICNHSI